MTSSNKTPVERPLLVDSPEALKEATGASNRGLQMRLIEQVRDALFLHPSLDAERRATIIQGAFEALRGIKPADELEGMLAVQMVATHNAAIDCLRRAMLDQQTFEGREINLKHASKFLGLYARQIEALDKHRGKGQQKVTVEHVHIESGAQAVVGTVHSNSARPGDAKSKQLALKHNSGQVLQPFNTAEHENAHPKKKRRDGVA